eukprot:scaffold65848_cov65-Attheya_sp.AAC.2
MVISYSEDFVEQQTQYIVYVCISNKDNAMSYPSTFTLEKDIMTQVPRRARRKERNIFSGLLLVVDLKKTVDELLTPPPREIGRKTLGNDNVSRSTYSKATHTGGYAALNISTTFKCRDQIAVKIVLNLLAVANENDKGNGGGCTGVPTSWSTVAGSPPHVSWHCPGQPFGVPQKGEIKSQKVHHTSPVAILMDLPPAEVKEPTDSIEENKGFELESFPPRVLLPAYYQCTQCGIHLGF